MPQIEIPEEIQGFGSTLRWLREQYRMTINMVSKKIGVTAQYWSDVEHDRVRLEWDRMVQVAEVFHVDPHQLKMRVGTLSKEAREFMENNPKLVDLLRELGRGCRSRCRCPHCLIIR